VSLARNNEPIDRGTPATTQLGTVLQRPADFGCEYAVVLQIDDAIFGNIKLGAFGISASRDPIHAKKSRRSCKSMSPSPSTSPWRTHSRWWKYWQWYPSRVADRYWQRNRGQIL